MPRAAPGVQLGLLVCRTSGNRRSVREHAYHTRSRQWGQLRDTAQFIVTHRPELTHSERVALIQKVREWASSQDFAVAPWHTMLTVGAQLRTQQQSPLLTISGGTNTS